MIRNIILNLIVSIISVFLVLGSVIYLLGLSRHPDTMRVSPLLYTGGIILAIIVAHVLARIEGGCRNFNGTGTILYGQTETEGGGHISTKWIVFVWIPLIPVRSVEVLPDGVPIRLAPGDRLEGSPANWRPLPGVGLDLAQVVLPLLAVWGSAGVAIALLLW